MCGITGCFVRKGKVEEPIVRSMMEIMRHRGPDDSGYKQYRISEGELGMGFVRLSIRDLSLAGHQPMLNKDGTIAITLNGEIYNADELRPQLEAAGCTFNSTSDTEVLLNLYIQYGIKKMLSMLDGMYAICIADTVNDCFYLIRDRIGEKPLYIYEKDNVLLYASEYKSFYCHPSFKAELDDNAVSEYFLFRYVSDGDTLLKGVKNLQPGSYLKIDSKGSHHIIYWDFSVKHSNNYSFEDNKNKYKEILKKGLRRRLISDRKVGLQLSGGVDSSYLAHLIPQITNEPLHTFSIVFDDKAYSEEDYMSQVINKVNCVPHSFAYTPDLFFSCWRELTWYFEAPMNHEGSLGLFYLNRRAKEHITVMLCGEGADETLGGYNRFYFQHCLMFHPAVRFINWYRNLKKGEHSLSISDSFISSTQYVSNKMFSRLFVDAKQRKKSVFNKRKRIFEITPGDGLRKYMNYEAKTYMQDLLMRADKTSMASSIELRVPYIMPDLVEFACEIPDSQLVSHTLGRTTAQHTKKILKSLCSDIFGSMFTFRKKRGFPAPICEYFRSPLVASFIETVLFPGIKKRGIVNYTEVLNMWNICKMSSSNNLDVQWPLWCVFSFELWAQMYIDNSPSIYHHEVFN